MIDKKPASRVRSVEETSRSLSKGRKEEVEIAKGSNYNESIG